MPELDETIKYGADYNVPNEEASESVVADMADLGDFFDTSGTWLEVQTFLMANGFLKDLLYKTLECVQDVFGADTKPSLHVSPDYDGSGTTLQVRIPTDLAYDEAVLALDKFDEMWGTEAYLRGKNKLGIDVRW